ncbi:MAG: hypothetical protein RSD40_05270, partial [Bacilli bacterium]
RMSNTVLFNRINEKVSNLINEENVLIVLKGIPMSVVDEISATTINLEEISKNKIGYIFKIYEKRKFITYEEFLLLNSLIIDQYKRIYILNNNIYMEQYPIDAYYSDEVKRGLINHFMETDDDSDDESVLGDIDEFISLYNGLKEFKGYLLGAYCNEKLIASTKVENINLFECVEYKIELIEESDMGFVDIVEEADYIDAIKQIFNEPDEIKIRITNYTGDTNKLK